MTLQEIVTKFKKKSWLRMCTLNNINKWDIIDYLSASVYAGKFYVTTELVLATRSCFKCGAEFDLAFLHGNFLAKLKCGCADPSTNTALADKLSCVLTKAQVLTALSASNAKRRNGLPNTVEYWLNKGYTIDAARIKVSEIQKTRSAKSPSTMKGAREYSIRRVEYWLKRGYSEEEAKNMVKAAQTTNGLVYYNKKYGAAGKEMFDKRIAQWLNADGNKKMVANRSKKSLELFAALGAGFYGPNEQTVPGKEKTHRVDFLHEKKIIEYYGDYWHGSPKFYTEDQFIRKKKVSDVRQHDAKKVKDLEEGGYTVLVVWENDYVTDATATVKKCKDFIK